MVGKISPISSIFIKTFWFFWWKICNLGLFFHLIVTLGNIFWLGWPFSAPPMAYFYHSQLLKKNWWKLTSNSFHLNNLRSFDQLMMKFLTWQACVSIGKIHHNNFVNMVNFQILQHYTPSARAGCTSKFMKVLVELDICTITKQIW